MLIHIIIALLFPNLRLVLCKIFSYDPPKIRNLPKIFLRSFENVAPSSRFFDHTIRYDTIEEINVDSKAEYTA